MGRSILHTTAAVKVAGPKIAVGIGMAPVPVLDKLR
jgi:hypothetical protein